MLKNLLIASLFLVNTLQASYTYEANQSLIDLTGASGTTNLGASDDGVSGAFNIGFTFDYYGQAFTQARVATNGCLHFKTSGVYCNDYTPDPLSGQHSYTMYPFWTDLIRDNNSQVLAKSFSDKTVFGWYDMREYNRSSSDNSFEVILWANDTFEFRYGELDIINHDVLIGEVGSGTGQSYQYLFHDKCGTGTTNAGTCVSSTWNASSSNTLLENGGSLYGVGTGNSTDCSDPLNDMGCAGYADAYLTQQCDLTQLHSESCPRYWEAYDDQQCADDSQYAPFCAGYNQQDSVAYYTEEDMWYDEEYDEWLDPNDPCYQNGCENMTDADWYALDVEQFGQETVDEWMGTDITFAEDGMVEWDSTPMDSYDELDVHMDVWDIQHEEEFARQETYEILPYDVLPMDELLIAHELIIREEMQHESIHEEIEREEFETLEELDEWFEEELLEAEESIEEILADANEEVEETIREEEAYEESHEEESIVEELFAEEDESRPDDERKSSVRISALDIVAGTLRTASNSISSSSYSGSRSNSFSGSTSSYGGSRGSSSGGVSTSNSPSASDQFASSTAQTNQVLSMGSGGVSSSSGSTSFSITPMPTLDDSPQVMMADVQVQDMAGDIDSAVSGVMTASEADQVADKIIANNIKEQQEEAEQEQGETGEYADSTTLVAYLGYVQGFDSYRDAQIPQQDTWYEPRAIYSGVVLSDNTQAFYGLAGASLNTLGSMISMQPNL